MHTHTPHITQAYITKNVNITECIFIFYSVWLISSYLRARDEEKIICRSRRAVKYACTPLCFPLAWDKKCNNFFGRGSLSLISALPDCYPLPAVVVVSRGIKSLPLAGSVVCYCLPMLPWLRAVPRYKCIFDSSLKTNEEEEGDNKKRCRYPRCPRNAQVLHHFFKRRCLLCLLLVMQSDFLAEFPRIVRSRHVSLFCSVFLQWSVSRGTQ